VAKGNQAAEESKDGLNRPRAMVHSGGLENYDEEVKSPTKKSSNNNVKTDNVSNISTQRASQVVNRFTS